MSCWVNTMLQMACESTGGWNGSDRACQLSIVGGVIVISWVCRCCFFFFFLLFFVFLLFRGGACCIEREVVVGGGFWALRTPCLESLAWPIPWLLEFVGLGKWLP